MNFTELRTEESHSEVGNPYQVMYEPQFDHKFNKILLIARYVDFLRDFSSVKQVGVASLMSVYLFHRFGSKSSLPYLLSALCFFAATTVRSSSKRVHLNGVYDEKLEEAGLEEFEGKVVNVMH